MSHRLAVVLLLLVACGREPRPEIAGSYVGIAHVHGRAQRMLADADEDGHSEAETTTFEPSPQAATLVLTRTTPTRLMLDIGDGCVLVVEQAGPPDPGMAVHTVGSESPPCPFDEPDFEGDAPVHGRATFGAEGPGTIHVWLDANVTDDLHREGSETLDWHYEATATRR